MREVIVNIEDGVGVKIVNGMIISLLSCMDRQRWATGSPFTVRKSFK